METHWLYDGKVQIEYDDAKHRYFVDGEQEESVTKKDILEKPGLLYWGVRCCGDYFRQNMKPGIALDEVEIEEFAQAMTREFRKVSRTAANIGSVVHTYAHQWGLYAMEKGEKPELPVNPLARRGCNAFHAWVDNHGVRFLHVERVIYSKAFRYVGRLDAVAEVDGKVSLVDYKVAKGIYPFYRAQAAAYRQAYTEEMVQPEIERTLILRFDKETGKFNPDKDVYEAEDHAKDFDAFLQCMDLKEWM